MRVPVLLEREAEVQVNVFAGKHAVVLADWVAALEHQANRPHFPELRNCVPVVVRIKTHVQKKQTHEL